MLGFTKDQVLTGALPREAADKLASLRATAREARHLSNGISDDALEAADALRRARADVASFEHNREHGGYSRPVISMSLAGAKEWVAREEENHARLSDRRDQARDRHQALQAPIKTIERWLELPAVKRSVVTLHRGAEPKTIKNETPETAVERCRQRVRELKADLHKVQSAPYPSSYAKAVAAEYVERLRDIGAPAVHFLLEAGVPRVDWPSRDVELIPGATSTPGAMQFTMPAAPPHVSFAAWVNPEGFLASLCREIDLCADDDAALSADERFKRSAAIAAEKLAAERDEEFWIDKAGLARRPDIDPRAVLGLAVDLPALNSNF